MDLGNRIRTARKNHSISQEELARRAGVSLNLINKIERGVITDPHFSTLAGLANALNMQISELVGEPAVPLGDTPQTKGPPVVHFARLSDNAYEEVRQNAAYTPDAMVDLRRRVEAEYEQLRRWVRELKEEGRASSADMEEARELLKRASKRRDVAVFDVSERTILFDEKRPARPSRTVGKTVDEAYEEVQGIAKEDAASRPGEGSREQQPL